MSARGDDLTIAERVLAQATKRAVQSAGGIEVCTAETRIGAAQLSRCCSTNEPDSITLRDALIIDGLAGRVEGAPFIVRAMCRQLGGLFVKLPEAIDDPDRLSRSVVELGVEFGDVARAVSDALRSDGDGGAAVTAIEAERTLSELDQMDAVSAALRLTLERLAGR